MTFTYSLYYLPLLIAVLLSLTIIFYTWKNRSKPLGRALMILAGAAAVWAAGNILEYGFNTLAAKNFWAKIEYFGIETIPIAWFVFAALFTGRFKLASRRTILLLSIMQLVTIILVWTNQYHELMRYNISLDTNGDFSIISKTYGSWFWIAFVYNNLLLVIGTAFLINRLVKSPRLQKKQIVLLLTCAIIPWLGNILYVFRLSPWTRVDLTSTFLSISAAIVAFGLIRFHLMDIIIPIARDTLIEDMSEGILVLDTENRIVDCNPAFMLLFNLDPAILAMPFDEVIEPLYPELGDMIISENPDEEISLKIGKEEKILNVTVKDVLTPRKRFVGKIYYFHDVSQQKKSEAEREKMIADLQKALNEVNTLSGLLPICANCKKIRDDKGYWSDLELYVSKHSNAEFSHTLCADCMKKLYPEEYKRLRKKGKLGNH